MINCLVRWFWTTVTWNTRSRCTLALLLQPAEDALFFPPYLRLEPGRGHLIPFSDFSSWRSDLPRSAGVLCGLPLLLFSPVAYIEQWRANRTVSRLLRVRHRSNLPSTVLTDTPQHFHVGRRKSKFALIRGPGSSVGIATDYGLDGPRIESRWMARFSAPVQTGPGTHPASCTIGTGSFPGVKWPGSDADSSPPSSAVVKKEFSYTSTLPMGRTACT